MDRQLTRYEIQRLFNRSQRGDILVIGPLSWYHEDDFATNGWTAHHTGSMYTNTELVDKVYKYQADNNWWLY